MISYIHNLCNYVTDSIYKIIYPDTRFYYLSLIKDFNNINHDYTFSIHGLWPQNNLDSYPSYCKKVSFSVNNLNTILEDLHRYWYSNQQKDEMFWKHEYEKHGSCMFSDISEFDYFNLALNLYKEATQLNLPDKYYNQETGACLIPVSLDFKLKK